MRWKSTQDMTPTFQIAFYTEILTQIMDLYTCFSIEKINTTNQRCKNELKVILFFNWCKRKQEIF